MILINDNIRIVTRDFNFVIETLTEVQDGFMTNPENVGSTKWVNNGYFSNLSTLLKALVRDFSLTNEEEDKVNNLYQNIDEALKSFDDITIDVDDSMQHKIVVNDKWFLVGCSMIYRMIKKEQIQQSRFTKEENVGKDKFVVNGFVPNISVGLKSILNRTLIDLIDTDANLTFAKVVEAINEFVDNSNNIYTEDCLQNYDIESEDDSCTD